MKAYSLHVKNKGLTLVELLISMVIGMVVIGAVMVTLVGTRKAGQYQAAFAQMNEDAQVALSILSRDLQMAGYSQPTALVANPGVPGESMFTFNTLGPGVFTFPNSLVGGCDTGFLNPATDNNCGMQLSSAFEVVYEADMSNTTRVGAAPGTPSDCLGNAIPGVAPFVARNRYFLVVNGAGRPQLNCASNGQTEALVENIENMQVWYGVSSDPTSTQVLRYVTASQINALGAGAAAQWQAVVSVRVCLLVRSADPFLDLAGAGGEDSLRYRDCNQPQQIQVSNDRFLRRAYFTTATLRDRMPL